MSERSFLTSISSSARFRNQSYAKQGAPFALRKEGTERKIISKALVGEQLPVLASMNIDRFQCERTVLEIGSNRIVEIQK